MLTRFPAAFTVIAQSQTELVAPSDLLTNTLATLAIPSLRGVNAKMRVRADAILVSNANVKTLAVLLGGLTLAQNTCVNTNMVTFFLEAIIRNGFMQTSDSATVLQSAVGGQNISANLDLSPVSSLTFTCAKAVAGDLVAFESMIAELYTI